MARTPEKEAFAKSIADYVEDHPGWDALSKRDIAIEAVMVLLDDIGAAQEFIDTIGVPYDLYDSHNNLFTLSPAEEVNMKRGIKQILKYAAFFFAGSAAAGWAIADQENKVK